MTNCLHRLRFASFCCGYTGRVTRKERRLQYDEFIDRIRQRAGLGTPEEAQRVSQAALTVLGEYLAGREALDLAAQLPQGIAEILRQQPPDRSMVFSFADFVQRVCEEEGLEKFEYALAHARVVMGVLEEAVSGGEMEDVRRQLPSEFDPLFESGSGAS